MNWTKVHYVEGRADEASIAVCGNFQRTEFSDFVFTRDLEKFKRIYFSPESNGCKRCGDWVSKRNSR